MDQSQQKEGELETESYCFWHPDAETGLSCSQCGKSICTRCMVQAPVGIRCPDCGKAVRAPTYDVRPTYYARAIGVGLGVAIGGGIVWGVVALVFGGILGSVAALAIGYGAGELVSWSVKGKRSTGLAWTAGGAVVIALLVARIIAGYSFFGWYGLLFIGMGVYLAVQRVR